MNDSIFLSIKKMLGFDIDYNAFDHDIRMCINSALSILTQLGVGPADGYFITNDSQTWYDLLGNAANLEIVKQYVYLKVRHTFDPPASGSVLKAIEDEIREMEWRINIVVDPKEDENE